MRLAVGATSSSAQPMPDEGMIATKRKNDQTDGRMIAVDGGMFTTDVGVIATGRKEERGGRSYKREGLWHCIPSFSGTFCAAAPKHDLSVFLPSFTNHTLQDSAA